MGLAEFRKAIMATLINAGYEADEVTETFENAGGSEEVLDGLESLGFGPLEAREFALQIALDEIS